MTNANYRIEKMEITAQENNTKYGIVLGHSEEPEMWVTWCFKAEDVDNENFKIDYFWGRYYERKIDAMVDYYRRIIKELE